MPRPEQEGLILQRERSKAGTHQAFSRGDDRVAAMDRAAATKVGKVAPARARRRCRGHDDIFVQDGPSRTPAAGGLTGSETPATTTDQLLAEPARLGLDRGPQTKASANARVGDRRLRRSACSGQQIVTRSGDAHVPAPTGDHAPGQLRVGSDKGENRVDVGPHA